MQFPTTRPQSLNCRAQTVDEAVIGQRCPTLALDVPTPGAGAERLDVTHGSADTRSDADLLAAHAAGDPDAFGEVVRRHRDRLWAVALRTLGDREEAADAVQDALVSALRASGPRPTARTPVRGFRGESAVTTWLHRIVVNACLDRVRRKASRPADPLPDYDVPDRAPRPARPRASSRSTWTPPWRRCRPTSAPPSSWSTCTATPSTRSRRSSTAPSGTVKSRCARGRATPCPAPAARPDRPVSIRLTPPDQVRVAGNPFDVARVPPEHNIATAPAEGGDPHR